MLPWTTLLPLIFGGLQAGMQGAQLGMAMSAANPPQVPAAMPTGGRSLISMGNPYGNMMPIGTDPYGNMKTMQDQNIKLGLSSALKRYGGMYA